MIGTLLAMLAWYKFDWQGACYTCIIDLFVRKKDVVDTQTDRQTDRQIHTHPHTYIQSTHTHKAHTHT